MVGKCGNEDVEWKVIKQERGDGRNGKMEEGLEVREGRGRDPVIKRDMESE
jgi:hypothetical protein